MLIILLSWICITILVYLTGVLLHSFLKLLFGLDGDHGHFTLRCFSGLMVTSFISCLLCLFIPLGLVSNLLSVALACMCFIFYRSALTEAIKQDLERLRKGNWVVSLLVLFFLLIVSFLSYLPSSHHDDGLYYSTSIKWLQEYGTVKGLANISPRIGYNSSWHILQANFGFQYLKAGLFNDLNGLLFIWMLLYSAGGINNLIKGHNTSQNCTRALIMMPVLMFHFGATSDVILLNINFLGSSTADIPACIVTWLVFILFIQSTKSITDKLQLADILVVLYSIWGLTIKLSSIPIILLSVYILLRLIFAHKFRIVILLGCLCLAITTPWLARNILVSGYLLFPFSAIDIFRVEWKLPISDVKWNENAVRAFAIGADLEKPVDLSFFKWFPAWFRKANFIQQVLFGSVTVATVSYCILFGWQMFKRNFKFLRDNVLQIVGVITCLAGILFWLNKAPDFRFGYGFICFYCIYFVSVTCRYFLDDYLHYLFWPIAIYMAAIVGFYYKDRWMSARVIFAKPLPYRMPSQVKKVPLSDKIHINTVSKEDSWNAPLPVANEKEFNILRPSLIGRSISEGFRANKIEN